MPAKRTSSAPQPGVPLDTHTAAPGPHPHESADIRSQGGDVSKWADPMENRRTDETDDSDEVSI